MAAGYWKLAAELGYGGAQVDYAVACAKGDGLEKNMPEAYYWALIARRSNTSEEQERNLRALQGVITSGLEPRKFLVGSRGPGHGRHRLMKAKLRWVKAHLAMRPRSWARKILSGTRPGSRSGWSWLLQPRQRALRLLLRNWRGHFPSSKRIRCRPQ